MSRLAENGVAVVAAPLVASKCRCRGHVNIALRNRRRGRVAGQMPLRCRRALTLSTAFWARAFADRRPSPTVVGSTSQEKPGLDRRCCGGGWSAARDFRGEDRSRPGGWIGQRPCLDRCGDQFGAAEFFDTRSDGQAWRAENIRCRRPRGGWRWRAIRDCSGLDVHDGCKVMPTSAE